MLSLLLQILPSQNMCIYGMNIISCKLSIVMLIKEKKTKIKSVEEERGLDWIKFVSNLKITRINNINKLILARTAIKNLGVKVTEKYFLILLNWYNINYSPYRKIIQHTTISWYWLRAILKINESNRLHEIRDAIYT